MATPFAFFVINAYIALTGVGVLAFWTLAYRGYRRETATPAGTTVRPLREAA